MIEIGARLLLADELGQLLRPQRCLRHVFIAAFGCNQTARRRHGAASIDVGGAKYQLRTSDQHSRVGTRQARIMTAEYSGNGL